MYSASSSASRRSSRWRCVGGVPPVIEPFGPRPLSVYSTPSVPSSSSMLAARRGRTRDADRRPADLERPPWTPPAGRRRRACTRAPTCVGDLLARRQRSVDVGGCQRDQFLASRRPRRRPTPDAIRRRPRARRTRRRCPRSAPSTNPKRLRYGRRRRRSAALVRRRRGCVAVFERGGSRARSAIRPAAGAAGGGGRRDQITGHVASSRTSISGLRSRASSSSDVTSSP